MNRRETALVVIRVDVAKHGQVTQTGMRAYCENRISREAFEVAMQHGRRIFDANKAKEQQS